MVGTSAWTSYLKLEDSTSLSTQISNSIKLKLDDLCLKQTRTRWNLKYSKYSGQNLENSSPNSSSNSKNWRNMNSLCVRTRSFEARWNLNWMKSELVQALIKSLQLPFHGILSSMTFLADFHNLDRYSNIHWMSHTFQITLT